MNIKNILRLILAVFALVVLNLKPISYFNVSSHAASQSDKSQHQSVDTLSRIKQSGELRVGVSLFVPWTMKDRNGNLIGYEIDMANKLAEDIGVKVKLVTVPFKDVISGLLDDRYDIIMDGLYITPQRALLINFSEPEAKSQVTLLANRKFAGSDTLMDFNKPGIKIGAVAGTVYADLAENNLSDAVIQKFDDEEEMLKALLAEKLDAVIAIHQISELTLKNNPDKLFIPLSGPIGEFGEAFAIRKGDADFLNYINTWIRFYRQNGWLEQRRDYWFKNTKWESQL